MTRASASEWAQRVAAWRSSGKSAAAFSDKHGYSAKSLQWWSSELRRRGQAALPSEPEVRLARVVRSRSEAPSSAPSVVVSVGEARVEVRAGVDRATLELVLGALHAAQSGARR
jgi:hypothetical protein